MKEHEEKYLTLSEAAEYLAVSRVTVWRRIRDGTLQAYQASTSRREKLVKREDLDELRRPHPLGRPSYRVRPVRSKSGAAQRKPTK